MLVVLDGMVLCCCISCSGCCGETADCCEMDGLGGGNTTFGFSFWGKSSCLSLYDFDKRSLKAFKAICLKKKY